jgi:16S rRNA (guanine527-N7)-methyltransferase
VTPPGDDPGVAPSNAPSLDRRLDRSLDRSLDRGPDPGRLSALHAVLEESRRQGWLGPGAIEVHVRHAEAMAGAAGEPPKRFLDLGSGGGVPGLVLALIWPQAHGLLLDAGTRRVAFLEEACRELALRPRIATVQSRAEEAARRPELRGSFDLVVARGFGKPAVTAECAVGFLQTGGRVVVSEPPELDAGRWPAEPLARLGYSPASLSRSDGASFATLELTATPGPEWPRRTGVPAKRPLWI